MSRLVAAGGSETISVTDSWGGLPAEEYRGDGEPDVTYRLDYPGGEASAAIRLLDPS